LLIQIPVRLMLAHRNFPVDLQLDIF